MKTRERMSRLQFFSVMGCFMFGTVLRSVFTTMITGNDSWIMAFTGAIAYLPLLAVIVSLAKRYPGKSLFEINEEVFGPVIGRFFSLVYLYFFISTCAMNILDVGSFVTGYIMQGTPLLFILAVFMLAACYSIRKGYEPLARISTLLLVGSFLALIINFSLSLTNADAGNMFPMLNRPLIDYAQGTHVTATTPYGESIVFMMLLPMLDPNDSAKKPLIGCFVLTLMLIFLVHIREALTLGSLMQYVSHPNYETIRMIEIDDVITRIESVYAFIMISSTFFKICTLFYSSATGIAQITRMNSYKPLVLLLGAFITIYAVQAYPSSSDSLYWTPNVSPFIGTIIEYILPFVTLLAAWIKSSVRNPRKKAKEAAQG